VGDSREGADRRGRGSRRSRTSPFFIGPTARWSRTLLLRREIARRHSLTHRPTWSSHRNPSGNWDRIFSSHPDHLATGEADDARGVSRCAKPPTPSPSCCEKASSPHSVWAVWISSAQPTRSSTPHQGVSAVALQTEHKAGANRHDLKHTAKRGAQDPRRTAGARQGRLPQA